MTVGRRQLLLGALAAFVAASGVATTAAPRLSARHAWAGDMNDTLFALAPDTPVSIASVSKLVTAWVVLSADLPLDERIRIVADDAARAQHTASQLAVGSMPTRGQLLEWLLVASDNRAAMALARTFPGGWPEFQYAMRALLTQMQLFSFEFGDPSGLSPLNKASARDLGVLLLQLSQVPWFQQLATRPAVGGKANVNRFANDRSVQLLSGKTGFSSAAGYCLAMAERIGGQPIALVVLHARDKDARAADMNALRRYAQQALKA